MNPNQKLLVYFAKKHKKPSVTVLMKLCYLTDLIAMKKNGKPITNYKYQRYTFGPFDKLIYQDLEALVKDGVLSTDIEYTDFGDNNDVVVYKFAEKDSFDIGLSADELSLVEEVMQALGGYGAKALTDIAYKTKPMVALGATLGGTEHIGELLDLKAK